MIVKDKVIVGGTGGDQAHRGYLTAFYTKTGRLAWRWYVIPGPGEKGNETWKGDSWKFGEGSPWLTGSYDADLNPVYWARATLPPISMTATACPTCCWYRNLTKIRPLP